MTKFTKLPKILLDTMSAMKIINNVPEEMAIQAVLGVVNFATHAHYNIDPVFFGGNIIPMSEYFIALAPTAGAKSTVYKMLMKGISKFEEEEYIRKISDDETYDLMYAVWKKKYAEDKLKLTPINLIDKNFMSSWNKNHKAPEKTKGANYRVSKATVNGLINVLNTQPYAGLFSSEAGEFFNGHAMQKGKTESLALEMLTTLTNLWDGHPLERNTGVDNIKTYDRRFNMLFMLQAEMAKDWLSNSLYSDQGFVHRLLITHCKEWEMPPLDLTRIPVIEDAERKLNPFHDRIYKLLKRNIRTKAGTTLQLEPELLLIDRDALELMAAFSNVIQSQRLSKYSDWNGFAARAYEHTLRLAATLSVFDGKEKIDIDNAEAALELMEFYLDQRLSLELGGHSKNSNQIIVANKVYSWIKKKGGSIAHSKLTHDGPRCYYDLTVGEKEGIIHEMISRELIKMEEIDTGGKVKETRYVVL